MHVLQYVTLLLCSGQSGLLHTKHDRFVFLSFLLGQTWHLLLLESGGLHGVVAILVAAERGLLEEDAVADSPCGADGVLGGL